MGVSKFGSLLTANGLVLLETKSASSSSVLTFTNSISSAYDDYYVEIVGLLPSTNNVEFGMQVSTNGGSSYDTSSVYGFDVFAWGNGGTAQTNGTTTAAIFRNNAEVSNTSTSGVNGFIHLYEPASSAFYKKWRAELNYNVGSALVATAALGNYQSTTAYNAFQFFFSSGNITSGTIRVYGVPKYGTTSVSYAGVVNGYAPLNSSLVVPSTYLEAPYSNYHAEFKPSIANSTYDDEFDNTSGMSGSTNGLAAKWAWRNQGGASVTYGKQGWGTLQTTANNSNNWRIIEIAAFADGTYDSHISGEYIQADSVGMGIALVDGTNGDFYLAGPGYDNGTGGNLFSVQYWNSTTSWNSNLAVSTQRALTTEHFIRIVKSGSSLQWWTSNDGVGWIRYTTTTDVVNATRIGFAINESNNTGTTKLHIDYIRKVA